MILHIGAYSSKHILFPFIEFLDLHCKEQEHLHILCSKEKNELNFKNSIILDIFQEQKEFIKLMQEADQIFLHGIWYDELCKIFFQNKNFLPKTTWIPWSSDYYFPQEYSSIKKWLFKHVKYIMCGTPYDYHFIKKVYETKATWIAFNPYPNNCFQKKENSKKNDVINILVGNSANPNNNHFKILNKLTKFQNNNIHIYLPLVYGDTAYAKKLESTAKKLFQDKVTILKTYQNLDEYNSFLATIDIAIFNHTIQQAFGTTVSLLGYGAKVHLNGSSSLYEYFKNLGITLYPNSEISLSAQSVSIQKQNTQLVQEHFSQDSLIQSLHNIFANEKPTN